jgi:hypothetical protein
MNSFYDYIIIDRSSFHEYIDFKLKSMYGKVTL